MVWISIAGKAGSMDGVWGAGSAKAARCRCRSRDDVGPVLVGVPCLGGWLDKFDWHARTASAPQLSDKSGCNNVPGAKAAGTSVRSLSGGTGNSKGANGESRLVDPTLARGDTQIGPREGLLPSGQAAGRWYFPPLLCAAKWTPLVQAPAADKCQLTCGISHVREDAGV